MLRYVVSFILFIAGNKFVFANNLIAEKSNQSTVAIILGIVVLSAILLMLLGKQKRRFND